MTPTVPAPDTSVDDALAGLASSVPDEADAPDTEAVALESLVQAEIAEPPKDESAALLADLAANAPQDAPAPDEIGAALDSLAEVETGAPEDSGVDDTLADLAAAAPDEAPVSDDVGAALDSLAKVEATVPIDNSTGDALAGLAAAAPEETPEPDDIGAALDSLADVEVQAPVPDATDDTLEGLADAAPEDIPETDNLDAALDSLVSVGIETPLDDGGDDVLADLANAQPDDPPQADDMTLALDSLETSGAQKEPAETDLEDLLGVDDADVSDDLDDLLGLGEDVAAPSEPPENVPSAPEIGDVEAEPDDLDDLLGDLDAPDSAETVVTDPICDFSEADLEEPALDPLGEDKTPIASEPDDLDDLLGDLGEIKPDESAGQDTETTEDGEADDLDDLLGDLDDLDAPESVTPAVEPLSGSEAEEESADDLDDLLGDLSEPGSSDVEDAQADDFDDLLADPKDSVDEAAQTAVPDSVSETEESPTDDLDDLLGDLGEPDAPEVSTSDGDEAPVDDLDNLLGDLSVPANPEPAASAVDLDDLLSDTPADGANDDAKPTGEPEFAFGLMTGARPDAERLNRKRFRIALMGDFSGRAARGQLETGDALATREAILLDPDTVEEVIARFGTSLVLLIGKDGSGVEVKLGEPDDLHPDELYENVPILSDLQGLRAQLANGTTAGNAAQRLKSWGETYGTPVSRPKSRSGGNAIPANLKLSEFQQLIGDTGAELSTASPVEDMIAQIVGPHVRAVTDADTVAMQEAVDKALSSAMRLILHHPEFQSIEAQWRSLDLIARSIEVDDTLEVMLYDVSAEEIGADLAAAEDLTQSGIVRLLTEAPLDPESGRGGYSAIIGLYTFEETPPHAELLGRIGRVAAHVDAPFLAALSPTFMETAKEDRHPLVTTAWDTLRAMPEAGYLGLAAPRFLLRRPYGAKSEPIYEFDFEEFTMEAGLRGMLWANPVVLVAILLAKSYKENGTHMGLGSIMSLGDIPFHFVTDQYGDQVALPCTERNLTLDKVEKVMARGVMPVVSIKGRDEIRLASFQSLAGGDILGPWSDVPPPPPSPPMPAPELAADAGAGDDDDLGLDDLLAGFDDAATPDADPGDVDADLAALLEDL
ncbi:type VI secretion system contractile sheath large subunit [Sedimentitalea sp.]|uniref:type VI secretion system contractile sheath domain-containing protein n=1 Tax=Sedimentitalea sp. TaxID=2048915 RepID=UPI003299FF24